MLFRKTAYANSGELILSWSLESMEICIAQCVEVFFAVFKKDQDPWGFVLGLAYMKLINMSDWVHPNQNLFLWMTLWQRVAFLGPNAQFKRLSE